MTDDDARIMQRVQSGEVADFALLVRRYESALRRAACSRLGDPAWAEDVVQEAFLAAYVSRATYDASFSFRTWLWTILLNLCKRQWKRRAQRQSSLDASGDHRPLTTEPVTNATGLSCVIQAERVDRLRALLERLPDEQADALRLRFYGGLTFREIADAMNCHLNTAKSRVRYGLEKLADLMGEER